MKKLRLFAVEPEILKTTPLGTNREEQYLSLVTTYICDVDVDENFIRFVEKDGEWVYVDKNGEIIYKGSGTLFYEI